MTLNDEDKRRTPEEFLEIARAEEEEQKKTGRLKIFLGYAAGVGKTFSMLESARERKREGRDVVAAYVESHGRPETDALLEGLEVIPNAQVEYQGVLLPELDTDAVLARRPEIALVDELAHTNAPGSRHEKRWQDVEELLAAGIDVFTTLNVQHFESLKEVVTQITGVVVRETVPDSLLDLAFEIRLVDIPPEDLLQRLKDGKVYIPEQAVLAAEKFFKPGNLMALRELSLRRTAYRVDEQVRAYMESKAIPGPWPTSERLLVCVSGSPYSEQLIRTTRRLSDEITAPWYTLYVETPGTSKHLRENRERVWRDLRMAENLGALVAMTTAESVASAVIDYANSHHITKIVVGKPAKSRWREFLQTPLVDQLIRLSGPIDVYVVSIGEVEKKPEPKKTEPSEKRNWSGYAQAIGLVVLTTLSCMAVQPFLAPTNMVMLYLLAVVLAALRLGLRPAIITALLGVLAFDFFFVPPQLTLAVADTQYLLTFVAFFAVGVVISTLVSLARERADAIRAREAQTASLYYLSRDLSVAADIQGIVDAVIKNIKGTLEADVAVLLPEEDRLEAKGATKDLKLDMKEMAVADWSYRNRHPAGRGTETLISSQFLFIPLQTTATHVGVLGIRLKTEKDYGSPDIRRLLNAFATQITVAIERVRLVEQAEQAQILQAREGLEKALLNSISHDLRTPLVSITGALETLSENEGNLPEPVRNDLVETARGEALRMNRFVANLLDMTRLEAGHVQLKKEPTDVQELVGCALAAVEQRPGGRDIQVKLEPGLPPVSMDLVLMSQVLVNLFENAMKYSPPGSSIEFTARVEDGKMVIEVADRGPGVPQSDLRRIFDKFYRIPIPERGGGTGLGLAICKGIVEAHGGHVRAETRFGGGLKVIITLPVQEREE